MFLDIRKFDRMPNVQIRELCGVMKGENEKMDKVFSDGLAVLKELEIIELLKGCM